MSWIVAVWRWLFPLYCGGKFRDHDYLYLDYCRRHCKQCGQCETLRWEGICSADYDAGFSWMADERI